MKKVYVRPSFSVQWLKSDVMTVSGGYNPLDSFGDDTHDYGGEWKW